MVQPVSSPRRRLSPKEFSMDAPARLAENKQVYARYIELLNAQDFDRLPEVVDPER